VNELRNFPDFEKLRGLPVPLEELARLERLVRRLERLQVSGGEGTQATSDDGGLSVVLPPEPSGWGRLTGPGPVSGSYLFTELQDDGGLPPVLFEASGAYQGLAYEVSDNPFVPVGSPVRVWRGDGEHWRFRFDGAGVIDGGPPGVPLPPGTVVVDVTVGVIWVNIGGGGGGPGGGGLLPPLWVAFCPCIAPGAASGSGSGSGGGGAVPGSFSGCYGGNVADLLHLVVFGSSGCDHTYPLHNVSPGLLWSGGVETPVMGSCDAQIQLQCSGAPGGWTFSPDGGLHNYPATSSSTYPAPFEVNFAVADNPCGCGSFGVKVLP
jgi:hypothetical protein